MYKRITVTGTNIFFLVVMSAFLILNLATGIALDIIKGGNSDLYSEQFIYITTLINEYLLLLAPVLVLALVKKVNFKEFFRLNKLKAAPALLIVIGAVPAYFAASMLNDLVIYVLQFIGDIPAQSIPVPKTPIELIVGILIIAVTPAICEEMLHRGLMLRAYEKRGTYRAVFITALFFGFFHFDITNFFGTAFLGLVIAYYVVRTNSIFAGMLAHFLNNSLAECIQYFLGDNSVQKTITISSQELGGYVLYGIAGAILLAVLLLFFKKATRKTAVIVQPISRKREDAKSILTHWPVIVFLCIYFFLAAIIVMSMIFARIQN